MTEVVLYHHAQGLTDGVKAFADELHRAGHTVHTPDLYEGKTYSDIEDGVGYARDTGFGTIMERGKVAAEGLPVDVVYAGFSLGVMSAQMLAQTRAGARGALFFSGALPTKEFGNGWPEGVPVQIHMMEDDPWLEEDLDAARDLADKVEDAELFLYRGDAHLFADSSLPDYDEEAAALLKERVLAFLAER
jgi:dienelactone hydrolase